MDTELKALGLGSSPSRSSDVGRRVSRGLEEVAPLPRGTQRNGLRLIERENWWHIYGTSSPSKRHSHIGGMWMEQPCVGGSRTSLAARDGKGNNCR